MNAQARDRWRVYSTSRAGRNLPVAIAVGCGLGAIIIVGLIFGAVAWYPLVAAAVGLATWEVGCRFKEAGYAITRLGLVCGSQLIVWLSWPFDGHGVLAGFVVVMFVVTLARLLGIGLPRVPERSEEMSGGFIRDVSASAFVLIWIAMFGAFAAMISRYHTEFADSQLFIFTFMICVVASDVGGYGCGVMWGRHPLAPKVSPKKTWEGFLGSLAGAAIAGALSFRLALHHEWFMGVAFGLMIAIAGVLGDLMESQVKRDLGIKDMSAMLPGHGGMMDRLDSVLPAAAVSWLILGLVG